MAKLIEITGKALSGEWGTDDENGNGIPVLRTTNFTNEGIVDYKDVVTRKITKKNIEEKFLRKGDIIIEKSGGSDKFPVGRVIYFDGDENTYLFNNFTGLLRVKDQKKWYPKYVFYSLYGNYRRGGTRQFENKTTGLHNLKTDDYVSRYDVLDTEYSKQIEICNCLDIIYTVIKLRENELQKLDDLIKARFVELFDNGNYPQIKLGDACKKITDGTHKTPNYLDEGITFISAKNIVDGELDFSDVKHISEEEYQEIQKRCQTEINDILLSKSGSLGSPVIVRTEEKLGLFESLAVLKYERERFLPEFLCEQLKTDMVQRQFTTGTKGVAIKHLHLGVIAETEIIEPPMEEQKAFAGFVKQVDKSKFAVQKALDETKLLFDSLMQEYFG